MEPMGEQVQVAPEQVVQVLQRTELGAALWRAALWEAVAEAQRTRIADLELQRGAAVGEPAGAAAAGG